MRLRSAVIDSEEGELKPVRNAEACQKCLLIWCFTVCSLIEHLWAMSGFEYPATTRVTISSSRVVSP